MDVEVLSLSTEILARLITIMSYPDLKFFFLPIAIELGMRGRV